MSEWTTFWHAFMVGVGVYIVMRVGSACMDSWERDATDSTLPREMRGKDADTLATLYTADEMAKVWRAIGHDTPDVLKRAQRIAASEEKLKEERRKAQDLADRPYTVEALGSGLFHGWRTLDRFETRKRAVDAAQRWLARRDENRDVDVRVVHDGRVVWREE